MPVLPSDWDWDMKDRPASSITDAGLDPPPYEQPRSYDCMAENTWKAGESGFIYCILIYRLNKKKTRSMCFKRGHLCARWF